MFLRYADHSDEKSLAWKLRQKRNEFFRSQVMDLPRPLKILDVGGTQRVWETIGFAGQDDIQITLVNQDIIETTYPNIRFVLADARDLGVFDTNYFDVAYSNSVIEHLGSIENMRGMATEIARVSKRYFVQTPNYWFPIEPHFLFPGFQFLPKSVQCKMLQRFDLGWIKRTPDREQARMEVESIQLLSASQLQNLFPYGKIYRERLAGLTKSLIIMRV